MSRRMYLILSWIGLSAFLLFMLVDTTPIAFAHGASNQPHPFIHNISNKLHPFAIPSVVDTSVLCAPQQILGAWSQTGNGPGGFGCGGQAWEVTTPTTANVTYSLGIIGGSATYTLRAFITNIADAPMNYDIYADNNLLKSCFFDQIASVAWTTICSFSVNGFDGQQLAVFEWSGAVHSFTMSSSAIQI